MDLARIVSSSLRIGVLTGTILSVVGLFAWSAQGFPITDAYSGSRIIQVLGSSLQGNAAGIIGLGVIVLIATPLLRVLLSVFFFASERDRKYVVITLLVFGMLVFALLSGTAA